MKQPRRIRKFLHNEHAISEEFTTLPALSVVMIGFTLFIVLLANTYSAYHMRMDQLEKYQTADLLATKILDPSCPFAIYGRIIELDTFLYCGDDINETRKDYWLSDLDFLVRISWEDETGFTHTYDMPKGVNPLGDRIAVSHDVSIQTNPAERPTGKLTILIWSV